MFLIAFSGHNTIYCLLTIHFYCNTRYTHNYTLRRYEVNPSRVHELELAGLRFTGRDEYGERMEIAELSRDVHPHFLGM